MDTKRVGFESMDKEKQRKASSEGGKASVKSDNHKSWNSETARLAAKKSAEVRRLKKANQEENNADNV